MPNANSSAQKLSLRKPFFAICVAILTAFCLFASVFAEPIHTRLNPDLVEGGEIQYYATSPDGSYVAYIADQEKDNVDELYIVPIEGEAATKLNAPLVEGGNVISFRFTPDGNRVIYSADQEIDNQSSLYSVPTTGGVPLNLSCYEANWPNKTYLPTISR